MTLDVPTIQFLTAVVMHVAGGVFVLETMLRKDDRAGRVWALGFIGGMIATEAYIVRAVSTDAWWLVAIGNAAWVAALGLLWLGCRVFNGHRLRRSAVAVIAASVATVVMVLLETPTEGWSASPLVFGANALFSALTASEATRGAMRRTRTALGLSVTLGLAAAFQLTRSLTALALGTEHPVFQTWLSNSLVGIVTMSLIVIVVVLTSVLRAEQVRLRGTEDSTLMAIAPDGVLLEPSFVRVLGGRLMRANRRAELFAVLVVKIDALSRISTAFGADEAEHVRQAARAAVRRLSPTTAAMGTDDEGKLLLAFQPKSPAEARQLAARMHRAMLDQLRTAGVPVIPPIGMGLSVTSTSGYDRETLLDAARAAARRAIASDDVTVVVAGEDDDADSAARGDQAVRR
ncbi:diguanylate cyclase domain-containing protein [Agrococcus jenensis]|uniref:GGDEF domain-containing protein n=1 Tax=Agrococcus jenensis TaxID=46353 RepID=A0A3N2AVT9_9MICO|nr:diguanylate cyclase [Agrococcus jenensis]ROR67028.1 GGDEF domain-containing protein [Agrococcus jenensis]